MKLVHCELLLSQLLRLCDELALFVGHFLPVPSLYLSFLFAVLIEVALEFLEAEFELGFFGFVCFTHLVDLHLKITVLERKLLFVLQFHLIK